MGRENRPCCQKMKNLSALNHNEPTWQRHLHEVGTIPYEESFGLVGCEGEKASVVSNKIRSI